MVAMRGFLNKPIKAVDVVAAPKLKDDERLVQTEQLKDLCHHIHSLIRSDHAYLTELEKRVRAGTNTECIGSKYKDSRGSGCCGGSPGDEISDTDRMIQAVLQAEEAKQQGLPGAQGPTKQQLDDLVHNFSPKHVPCCGKIKFQFVDDDPVGEVLERCIGCVNEDMGAIMIEVMTMAQSSYSNVLKKIENERKEMAETGTGEEEAVEEPNEFMKNLQDSDNPALNNLKAMLGGGGAPKLTTPAYGSVEDKFSRQMILKEALIKVLKIKVSEELTIRHKNDSRTGGLTATPGGWKLCPLEFIPQSCLGEVFKKQDPLSVAATIIPQFMNTPAQVMADVNRMDNDGILRTTGQSTRLRKAWISVESYNQKEFPMLTNFMLRYGSMPFEINKKTGYHLQIPSDFLFERTYLHAPNSSHHETEIDRDVLQPKARLECGSEQGLDNGRALAAVYCLEEPKLKSTLILTSVNSKSQEKRYELKKDAVILYQAKDTISRVEHRDDEAQAGASTIVTLFLKGHLK